jgi:mono/diheme cytochrome c family protein
MKLWAKLLLGVVVLIVLLAGSAAAYVSVTWDKSYDHIAGPDLATSTDSAVLARGEYLVRGPAHCGACHVGDWTEAARVDSGHPVPMRGGLRIITGPLGTLYSRNLTPDSATGIGRYTDRQLFRMLRHNIKPDGMTSVAPLMPFANMADEDLVAVVSYLRSQPAVRNEIPAPLYTSMGKAIRTMAAAFQPVMGHTPPAKAPPEAATRERGEYVARYVANCVGCHTKLDETGSPIGREFAGGAIFETEPGSPGVAEGLTFRTVNLTPDSATGALVRFGSKENWIKRFRQGRVYKGSLMPWGSFTRISDTDLEALWVFFNSLPPVRNDVSPSAFRDSGTVK